MSLASWTGGRRRASVRGSGQPRKSIPRDHMGARHPNPRLVARPPPAPLEARRKARSGTLFEGRCWARATLYAADEFDVQQAVDALQAAAIATRLVADIGQDRCQQIIAEAFLKVRQ